MIEEPLEPGTMPSERPALQDRLASCRSEIRRLTGMKRRQWISGRRGGLELKAIVRWLRLREAIADTFWRTFSLIIGSSCVIAATSVATLGTTFQLPVVTIAAVTATITIAVLVFWPPDGMLDRRRLVLSQLVASANHEYQNICSQLDVLHHRRDTVHQRLSTIPGQPASAITIKADSAALGVPPDLSSPIETPSDSETSP